MNSREEIKCQLIATNLQPNRQSFEYFRYFVIQILDWTRFGSKKDYQYLFLQLTRNKNG